MEADIRGVAGEPEGTFGGPGDLSAPQMGEERPESARSEEGPLTDFQIGMIGGGLLGLAAGLLTAVLIALGSRGAPGSG